MIKEERRRIRKIRDEKEKKGNKRRKMGISWRITEGREW
jgi:hypothetical protein